MEEHLEDKSEKRSESPWKQKRQELRPVTRSFLVDEAGREGPDLKLGRARNMSCSVECARLVNGPCLIGGAGRNLANDESEGWREGSKPNQDTGEQTGIWLCPSVDAR